MADRQRVSLGKMVAEIVGAYGWDELAARVPVHCFEGEPSIDAAVAFLERTPAARVELESLYEVLQRERDQARRPPAGGEPRRRARRRHAEDLRAAAGLVVDATKGVVDVVEGMHTAIGAVPVITPLVYRTIRDVTGVVGDSIDSAIGRLAPLLGESAPGRQREAVLAALNGVLGDHLEATKSPLAIPMSLRPPLGAGAPGGTLLVLVHGSCLSDLSWARHGHDHGCALARDLGLTPAYVHYNTGRHVSDNGQDLAALLERESAAFGGIVVLGHSLGGLVARAAIRVAEEAGHAWRPKLRALVTLGTPHHGAPLERAGNLFETLLGSTKYSAPLRALGEIRSAGVTDLRYGNVGESDWRERDRFLHGADPRTPTPLPEGVPCYAVAATSAPSLDLPALPSDGLVPVASALGEHPDGALALRFTETRVVAGLSHLDLLSSPEVYAVIRAWLDTDSAGAVERRSQRADEPRA